MKFAEDFIALIYRSYHSEYLKDVVMYALKKFDKFCEMKYHNPMLDTILAIKKQFHEIS